MRTSFRIFSFILLALPAVSFSGCSKGEMGYAALDGGPGLAFSTNFERQSPVPGSSTREAALFAAEESIRDRAAAQTERLPAENPAAPPAQAGEHQEQLLVKRAGLRCRVENLEEADNELESLIKQYRGYAASRNIYENSRSYTLRIPSVSYEAFLSGLDTMGRPLHRWENAEDVTLQYYDLESRLETKRELLETFRAYLRKAGSIEDILAVEGRIAELQQEIDWMGTRLKGLADLVDYATIELELLGPATAASYSKPTLGDRVGDLFRSFGDFLASVLVVLTGIVVYGIPSVLLLALLYWILLGRVGLLKKLWRLIRGKRAVPKGKGAPKED